jgi:hypothetical protein
MTTVGLSSAAIAWGKSPGIQINGDGTYVWYQENGKPPVKGKWLPPLKSKAHASEQKHTMASSSLMQKAHNGKCIGASQPATMTTTSPFN